jgi:hypothetical protein
MGGRRSDTANLNRRVIVLKKAGIIVAASAVSLLAVGGGVAFADGADQHGGLINVQNTNVQVPVQACNNSVLEGALGILGKAKNKDKHDGKCKQDNDIHN